MIETNKPPLFWAALLILLAGTVTTALIGRRNEHFAPLEFATWTAPAPPQGGGYAYRRTITIDHTKVPNTDQSNFPLLISGTYSYLATVANGGNVQNANGYDVIFTSDVSCATKLDHEVQMYSATTGTVNYWVRVPVVSHTNDTTIYVCYGNSAITTDQSNKTGVWDSNFKAVYHLDDQAANTTVSDSSANGSNGVNAANTSGKTVSGKLGRALTYNGSSDNTATGVTQTSSFTWECWFKLTDWTTQAGSSNYSTLMAGTYASGGALLMLWKDSAYVVQFAPDNVGGITSGANSVAPGAWHHAAYTRTGNNGTYALYFDGDFKGQVASGVLSPSTTITLGRRADTTSQALNGVLDETRISNVARSADWIKTEYNNQSSPATFYTISASSCCDTSTSRLDPMNATGGGGENPLSRNFNWNLPLVGLPGRAGMDLSLSLSYNSLVWTKSGSYISFDDDRGFPGPGFRLGFPVLQPLYYNAEVGKYAFLLIGTDGSRTELRQVGSSSLYEAADSSHLLLDSTTMVLRTTDGTQLSYTSTGNQYDCTQIKDRNGNYLTISYTAFGRIDTITDTLARTVKFNYDVNGWLTSITQIWNQGLANQVTHSWATFEYVNTTIQTNFPGITVVGPANGSTIKTLSKVTLADGSRYDFSYTSWGQVWKVSSFAADNHLLNYRSYNLPQTAATAYTDCPRFTERHDWAENWNQNVSGVEQEAITTYATPIVDSWTMPDNSAQTGMRAQVTAPDLTSTKIYFIGTAGTASGWQRGLPALVNTYDSNAVLQRQAMTTWTQDNTAVSYPLNPRVVETNIYDPAGNRARVQMTYQQVTFANGTSCQLPRDVYEYAANASTILRSTRTDYNTSTAYTDRRIIGLASEKRVYEGDVNNGGALAAKVGFFYDNDNGASSIQGTDAPVQHDNTNYSATFVTGRANLSSVKRYDVTNTAQFATTTSKYNTAGAVVSTADALNHTTQLSYADSFADGISRNTFAYPTTLTDPDSYTAATRYNFDFGAVTYWRTPQPNTMQNLPGPEQTIAFDTLGRLEQTTNQVNGAYTRYVYSNTMTRVDTYATIQDGLGEAHSFTITDGAGRAIGTATDHPGSVGGYSGQRFIYDIMGRTFKTSNPTETSASGAPSQWTTAGDDAPTGWIYMQQTYDWKGRPLVTTNQDGTTRTASYSGCGCAGGEVVMLSDEMGRKQQIYSDVLGRRAKVEVLNGNGTVYSTLVNSYNARDQVTRLTQYAGDVNSTVHQDTIMSYDGYGRLQSQHDPEQETGYSKVFTYYADDQMQTSTDARGASTTYTYNGRHLVTGISYSAQSGILVPGSATFTYDAVGNRLSMIDGLGSCSYQYDQLSRLISETRGLNDLPSAPVPNNAYTTAYSYNLAGALMSITDPFGKQVNYTRDVTGRLSTLSRPGYGGIPDAMSDIHYRAMGKPSEVSLTGNGHATTVSYQYDSRFAMSRFQVTPQGGGMTFGARYDRYADGQVSYAQDLADPQFDRSYSYDEQMGRVTQGLSGAEARGSTPADGPYKQTYTYDVFSNLTARASRHWTRNTVSQTATFVNNRNSQWQYDLDGRPIQAGTQNFRYDAAGRQINSSGTPVEMYDGDGRRLKDTTVSPATYELRSTVLGGQIVNYLFANGDHGGGVVYADGVPVAQASWDLNGLLHWQLHTPINSGVIDVILGLTVQRDKEFSPIGDAVGVENPYVSGGEGGGGYPGSGGDPSSMRCAFDGMEVDCSSLYKFFLRRDFYFIIYSVVEKRFTGTVTMNRAMLVSGGSHDGKDVYGTAGPGGIPSQVEIIGEPDRFEIHPGTDLTQTLDLVTTTARLILPQNPVPTGELERVGSDIEKAIAAKRCADFLKALLDQTAILTGQPYRDIRVTFDNIKFSYGDTGAYGGFATGSFENGTAAAVIRPFESNFISADRSAFIRSQTAQNFLGETLHHVGTNSAYTDGSFANALNAILVRQGKDSKKTFSDRTEAEVQRASMYWHQRQFEACKMRY
jgi:YD repeat-containing protein